MKNISDYLKDEFLLEEVNSDKDTPIMPDILLDADALIALAKQDDSNHQRAIRINDELQKRGVSYMLSPFTIAEAATVLSYKVSHQAAKKFLKQIRELDIPAFDLKEEQIKLADFWFNKQSKKGISYFDCFNMVLLDRYKKQIEAIFSFDSIYKKNGFKIAEDIII